MLQLARASQSVRYPSSVIINPMNFLKKSPMITTIGGAISAPYQWGECMKVLFVLFVLALAIAAVSLHHEV
jgi:hypothetical protein